MKQQLLQDAKAIIRNIDLEEKERIIKACEYNLDRTSVYGLNINAQILYKDGKMVGHYITLKGTRCKVQFFVNQYWERVRKPQGTEVMLEADESINEDFFRSLSRN